MSNETIGFGKALSELSTANGFLDSYSYIEVSKKNTQTTPATYESYKTPLSALNTAMIETYALYNNLEDIFNSNNYISCAYFGHDTYFSKNPYVHRENNKNYDQLHNGRQLITRKTFTQYMDEIGICIPVMNKDSRYHYYDADYEDWRVSREKFPIVMSYQNDSIWTIKSNLKFQYFGDSLSFTPKVVAPKNMLLNVCGNIFLEKDYEPEWYESQNFIVGLTVNGKVIHAQYLKNILKINDYIIAQFHFNCPLHYNTEFKIFTTAQCQYFIDEEEKDFPRKLFSGINAVNLSYYD